MVSRQTWKLLGASGRLHGRRVAEDGLGLAQQVLGVGDA
jgi:hypothetical protein